MVTWLLFATILAQTPAGYDAVMDRGPRPKPALVRVGPAGSSFNDPAFGTRMWRVTDRLTRLDVPDRSYRTPSGTHQNAWSADSSYFYVVSTDGAVVPFAFEPASGRFSRLDPLKFYIEPQFSYVNDSVVYGSASGGSLRTIDQYDFGSQQYTRLLDLDTLAAGLQNTYVGGIVSSAGSPERILAFFGGTSQDQHHYVVVFSHDNPQQRLLLDTAASTVNGKALPTALDFKLHHATIDRSGRYVALYPSSVDLAAPRKAAQVYLWDTLANTITALPLVDAHSGGHDAYGYGTAVNQDCCTGTKSWDAAEWQLRQLDAPIASRDLIQPLMTPKETNLADHPTWNNARPDRLVPFVSGTYRYGANPVEWRPWDDEIVAVQTDVGDGGAEVWRFAHHRSDVRSDNDPAATSFWYLPRPNVSRDGRWVLFTSNWEKTLGTDPKGAAGEKARQDVFLLRLPAVDEDGDNAPFVPLQIVTASLPIGKATRGYVATLAATRPATWYLTAGMLPPGLTLSPSGEVSGMPLSAGQWTFEVTAAEPAGFTSRTLMLVVSR